MILKQELADRVKHGAEIGRWLQDQAEHGAYRYSPRKLAAEFLEGVMKTA